MIKNSILTNERLTEINNTICAAMANNQQLTLLYFQNDEIRYFIGFVHFVNDETEEIRAVNEFNDILRVNFEDLINVYN
ncbi:YolD-like family protein [Metabacillus dongyingensis]|uniref:YolD-like family protein n=1 Tax=Metabacillus dongyingensis TaxID=2874282 RepID=UPI003B8B3E88